MFDSLSGNLVSVSPGSVVLEVAGVGFQVSITLAVFGRLQGVAAGERVRLLTELTWNEKTGPALFGFGEEGEREVFRLLLGGSGVGPRLALAALSVLEPAELVAALAAGDLAKLCRVPGIGKRRAEKLCVELKDRAAELSAKLGVPAAAPTRSDAVAALVSLGYPQRDAEVAVERARAELGEEAELRAVITTALARLRS
jgi:Holliday junction DNA helicase RuvA